jgi:ArsR family transcriptional regulator, arsenate/arsenite/antimonite-responsive transcriptional repressor
LCGQAGAIAKNSRLRRHLYFDIIGNMKSNAAVRCLTALAHETRLGIFRLLVRHAPEGQCAGDISQALKLAPATASFHLKELAGAGLISARPEGRHIYYAPDFQVMRTLTDYLLENCCQGRACAPSCAAPTPAAGVRS